MLRLAFDFIITWRETRTRPNAYNTMMPDLLPKKGCGKGKVWQRKNS